MQKTWPQFEVGKWLFILNFGIVLLSGVVFKNVETVLYASITIFISSKFMDSIIYGVNRNKLFMIISDEAEKIKASILALTNKGVTVLSGEGGYSQGEKRVILCAVDKNEYNEVEKIITDVDDKAFIIVTDTSHIVGNGFKTIV